MFYTPGSETKGQSKVSKKPHPWGKKSKETILYYYIKRIKEHFKSTFLLLLFKVNVSSVKLLAVIKYFLSPLASLNHSRKIDRTIIILMKRTMLYNISDP